MKTLCCALLAVFLVGPVWTSRGAGQSSDRNERVEALLPEFRRHLVKYRRVFHSPGVVAAIVTPDSVHYVSSGRRRMGSAGRVSERTYFQFASVSKPITGTFVGRLVAKGKLDWNTPIPELMPGFRFASQATTDRTTVLDMLVQRSGLPFGAGNMLEDLGFGRGVVLDRMRLIDTTPNFRKHWAYVNYGITIGGVAAANAVGKSFVGAIEEELFRPLGMTGASAAHRDFAKRRNKAQMNFVLNGRPQPLFVRGPQVQMQAPGGSVSGRAIDLAKFVQLYLNDGRIGDRVFIPRKQIEFLYKPHFPKGDGTGLYYGVCWEVSPPGSREVTVQHGGTFAGVRTLVSFRPKQKVGVVVLSNAFLSLPPEAIADVFYALYERGRVPKRILRDYRRVNPALDAYIDLIAKVAKSPAARGAILGRPATAYAGAYHNAYFGRLEIVPQGGGLALKAGPNEPPMALRVVDGEIYVQNRAGDTFRLVFSNLSNGRFQNLELPDAAGIGWPMLTRVP